MAKDEVCMKDSFKKAFVAVGAFSPFVICYMVAALFGGGLIVGQQMPFYPDEAFEQQLSFGEDWDTCYEREEWTPPVTEDLESLAGRYLEIGRYYTDDELSDYTFVERQYRRAFMFRRNGVFILEDTRDQQNLLRHGFFDLAKIELEDIPESYRRYMYHIDERSEMPLYHVSVECVYTHDFDLFILRLNDDDVIIYWPAEKEVIVVRQSQHD